MIKTFTKLKLWKAQEYHEITPEVVKFLENIEKKKFLELLNDISKTKNIPKHCNIGII